ncbi:MAG: Hint domain-containing protein [Silicimonas sp.]|nr:Hint domain-containing protein [Silicimonas sp.]
MNMMARPSGTFVISWAQTEVDGLIAAPVASLDAGAIWIWRGEAVQIDGATGIGVRPSPEGDEERRRRAASGARRVVARALALEGVRVPYVDDSANFDRAFVLTDGHRKWTATLIEMPEIARPLLMFSDRMPPQDTPLYIAEGVAEPILPSRITEAREGVVCFTPGTMLETPEGLRAVETLVAGDRVVTKDAGAQTIVWAGSRNVSGARLYAMPDLRPVRIREGALGTGRPNGDLIVSPDHRMLVGGAAARALWGEDEVLVAARDLIDGQRIARDLAAKSVVYHHLMLEHHHVLIANGVETESFHPAAASLDAVEEDQRTRLFDVMPDLASDAESYGPTTRRSLSKAEAALLPGVAA